MRKHALSFMNGPGICGAGQGQKLFSRVVGTPIDALAIADIDALVDCKRCRKLVRERFPLWFDIEQLRFVKR